MQGRNQLSNARSNALKGGSVCRARAIEGILKRFAAFRARMECRGSDRREALRFGHDALERRSGLKYDTSRPQPPAISGFSVPSVAVRDLLAWVSPTAIEGQFWVGGAALSIHGDHW
jgi:hypothetical protein